jgi:hypothetical protein
MIDLVGDHLFAASHVLPGGVPVRIALDRRRSVKLFGCCLVYVPVHRSRTHSTDRNSTECVSLLQKALETGQQMAAVGAYLHHYARFGVGKDQMEEAFARVAAIVRSYERIWSEPGH